MRSRRKGDYCWEGEEHQGEVETMKNTEERDEHRQGGGSVKHFMGVFSCVISRYPSIL